MSKKNFITLLIIPLLAGVFFMSALPAVLQDDKKEKKEGIFAEPGTYDFGTIKSTDKKLKIEFVIHNNTVKAVSFTSIVSSCNCITTEFSKEPIEPGSTGTVTATFDPKSQFGTINKKLTVKTDSGNTIILNIKGIVE